MSTILRKTPRRTVGVVAYLYTAEGWPIGECRMRDVSAGGARFVHAIADELPTELLLCLSKDGRVRRHCEVVWRKDDEVGVRFLAS
jgi:PilZ domain